MICQLYLNKTGRKYINNLEKMLKENIQATNVFKTTDIQHKEPSQPVSSSFTCHSMRSVKSLYSGPVTPSCFGFLYFLGQDAMILSFGFTRTCTFPLLTYFNSFQNVPGPILTYLHSFCAQ